jgi:predicted transcriptional regulator
MPDLKAEREAARDAAREQWLEEYQREKAAELALYRRSRNGETVADLAAELGKTKNQIRRMIDGGSWHADRMVEPEKT